MPSDDPNFSCRTDAAKLLIGIHFVALSLRDVWIPEKLAHVLTVKAAERTLKHTRTKLQFHAKSPRQALSRDACQADVVSRRSPQIYTLAHVVQMVDAGAGVQPSPKSLSKFHDILFRSTSYFIQAERRQHLAALLVQRCPRALVFIFVLTTHEDPQGAARQHGTGHLPWNGNWRCPCQTSVSLSSASCSSISSQFACARAPCAASTGGQPFFFRGSESKRSTVKGHPPQHFSTADIFLP